MGSFVSQVLAIFTKDLDQGKAIIIFSLIMMRMLIVVNLVPFLGSKNAPASVKVGLSVLLTALIWPAVISNIKGPIPDSTIFFISMMIKEAFIGFTIGFITAHIFYAVEMCGQLIDVARGANQIQLMIPELQERSSAFGTFYYQLMLALYLASGLHTIFFHALIKSFIVLPINTLPPMSRGIPQFFDFISQLLPHVFLIGVTLALPVIAVCLLIDIAFGLINRIAPQINAYFMSMPVKTLGGVVISLAALSMTIGQFSHYTKEVLEWLLKSIEMLR